ncbi:hypothetical protein OUZ56_018301 [Daphnia magna]|uniref:Uncharacterized protein n=1 Tax=Daphnia magna TaxID=35525 RepID=A0ABQ9Z8H2_9CRUS|nr:hypothetical protein OUZ56_018301 [Daphnia magna]
MENFVKEKWSVLNDRAFLYEVKIKVSLVKPNGKTFTEIIDVTSQNLASLVVVPYSSNSINHFNWGEEQFLPFRIAKEAAVNENKTPQEDGSDISKAEKRNVKECRKRNSEREIDDDDIYVVELDEEDVS